MANSKTRTGTSNALGSEYQVFLSFRGPDTRRGFTNSLYHALVDAGIRVFIDDEELRPGERISGNLLRAIDDSKIYIPIFSKDYASSHWCLRELAKMVENTSRSKEDGKKKVILPIFYDVKPDDVKLKTAMYSQAILNLGQKMEDQKKKFRSEDVETWRKALKEVDGTKGWELEKYSGYGDLIKLVVNEVVVRLKTRQRQVTEDLVGMEDPVAAINNLIDIDSDGVRLIGIYGMGGIGKTTLAKIIFNQLCPCFGENCIFLDDVRETAKTKGLVELQEKLFSNISSLARNIDNIDHGVNMIGDTICNKKMLIVLDDVDEGNQIQKLIGVNSLYPGTRILITTRDKSVLSIRGFKYKFEEYEMVRLGNEDALKLFCRHAFNDNSPPANYNTLSKAIVSTADGLPLALEAIGSSLFGQKNIKIWGERLEKLKQTPHKDVLGKLRISYDALEPDQQQIFLDVACFFIGENMTNPLDMWGHCGFCPEDAIDVLTKRCMVKILDYDEFGMHDQFRDLGRAIAKQEGTRLWDRNEIMHKLKSTEIKGSVRALCLPVGDLSAPSITFTLEQIKRFPHIRFLSLTNGICKGNKWIDLPCSTYHQCLEAPNMLHLEDLVVVNLIDLELPSFGVEKLIEGSTKLKVLTLQRIRSIHWTWTPSFPEYSVLEKLTIYNCQSLTEIDCSIGKLRCLTDLSITYCSQLRILPEQIGELQNLQCLSLRSCLKLSELPHSVSKLVSLKKLDVSDTPIAGMPNTMGKFLHLQTLDLDLCHSIQELSKLPISLTTLRLGSSSLMTVPNFSYLTNLVELSLDHCHSIEDMPKLPISLTALRLRFSMLMTVLNLSKLTNLVDLFLSDGSEGAMATSNVIQTCDVLGIGRLSKLNKLHFCLSNVCAPTTELGSLYLLKELTLYELDLQTLNQLPPNLTVLDVNRTRVKQVHLVQLETAKWYGGLFRRGSRFYYLDAHWLTNLGREVFRVPGSLKMLQEFHMRECPEVQDIEFVSTLESLGVFSIGQCISLKSISGLSNLKNLKQLSIYWCNSLQIVEGIDGLEFLQKLDVSRCISMGNIFYASSSKIPDKCQIDIRCSGALPDSSTSGLHNLPFDDWEYWESYRRKILNGTRQASDSEIKTTNSEIEQTRDPLQKKNQEDKEKKRKRKME